VVVDNTEVNNMRVKMKAMAMKEIELTEKIERMEKERKLE
jgi:hypothetical protein